MASRLHKRKRLTDKFLDILIAVDQLEFNRNADESRIEMQRRRIRAVIARYNKGK